MVQTREVCTGSNRKCDQFPWFDPVPGRSRLLPIKYKFSAEYCLPFCRLLLYVTKMSPKRLRMFIILLVSQETSSSGKLHTIFVQDKQVSTSTIKRLRKPVRTRRFYGAIRWVRTHRRARTHRVSLNESEAVLIPWFAPSVHSNRCEPWKASEYYGSLVHNLEFELCALTQSRSSWGNTLLLLLNADTKLRSFTFGKILKQKR